MASSSHPVSPSYLFVNPPVIPPDEADATLVSIDPRRPYDQVLADYEVPYALPRRDDESLECDFSAVTHLCLKAYYDEQAKIMARVGVRWDWNFPYVFWHFLGRVVSQALFGDDGELRVMGAEVVGDRELVYFATTSFDERGDEEDDEIKVLEVSLGWSKGDVPLHDMIKLYWRLARPSIVTNIHCYLQQEVVVQGDDNSQRLASASELGRLTGRHGGADVDYMLPSPALDDGPLVGAVNLAARGRQLVVGDGKAYYLVYFSPYESKRVLIEEF